MAPHSGHAGSFEGMRKSTSSRNVPGKVAVGADRRCSVERVERVVVSIHLSPPKAPRGSSSFIMS